MTIIKKVSLFLNFTFLLFSSFSHAETICFLVKENSKVIQQEGSCTKRYNPYCSFNFAISLIGYNEGILQDATHPVFDFKNGYSDYLETWKQPHNPAMWIQHSCVWYTHLVTEQLGIDKFQKYITEFNYGNKDTSNNAEQDKILTRSWMSDGSLKISPYEQTEFLEKILNRQLPVSTHAYEMTKQIFFFDEIGSGWKLYGKTGTGDLPNPGKLLGAHKQAGWFVGWIEKGNRAIIFAHYVEHTIGKTPAGRTAKEGAIMKLRELILKL